MKYKKPWDYSSGFFFWLFFFVRDVFEDVPWLAPGQTADGVNRGEIDGLILVELGQRGLREKVFLSDSVAAVSVFLEPLHDVLVNDHPVTSVWYSIPQDYARNKVYKTNKNIHEIKCILSMEYARIKVYNSAIKQGRKET